MAKCGERFAFLLPPACEGLVGLGFLCSGEDFEVATEHLKEIRRRLIRSWNELIAIEEAAGSYVVTDLFRAEHDAWLLRFDDLEAESQFFASASDFEAIHNLGYEGVCLLDRMIALGESTYGADAVTAPVEPYTAPTRLDQLADLGRSAMTLAAIAVAGWVAYKVWDRYG